MPADELLPALDPVSRQQTIRLLRPTIALHGCVTPQAQRDRMQFAMTMMDSLRPRDTAEAAFAAQTVSLHHAIMETLHAAMMPGTDQGNGMRLRTSVAEMIRAQHLAMQVLQQCQAQPVPHAPCRDWLRDWQEQYVSEDLEGATPGDIPAV
jgi:hypothetical protein